MRPGRLGAAGSDAAKKIPGSEEVDEPLSLVAIILNL
jgi:hypothetical protein